MIAYASEVLVIATAEHDAFGFIRGSRRKVDVAHLIQVPAVWLGNVIDLGFSERLGKIMRDDDLGPLPYFRGKFGECAMSYQ